MACISGPAIIDSGLVLHLDAANPQSYSGGGTTWFDLSGNGNHVTLYNSPTFMSGSLLFDGINDYARTSNNLDLSNTNVVSIFYFLKLGSYGSTVKVIHELSSNFNSTPGSFISSYSDNSVGQNYQIIASIRGNAGYNIASYDKSLLNDLLWHNYCVIHDMSQSLKENLIYSDTQLKNELSNPVAGYASNNTENFLGNQNLFFCTRGGGAFFGNMQISKIMIYNRALSAAEIKQNFEATRGRYGI